MRTSQQRGQLILYSLLLYACSTHLSASGMNGSEQNASDAKIKFKFEEHKDTESTEAALRVLFPDGADAAEFLSVLTQAGARCVKEPMAPYLLPEDLAYFEKHAPDFLLNSKMLHCRYSNLVESSVATEWDVKTAEYPDGRIKGLSISRFLVGP